MVNYYQIIQDLSGIAYHHPQINSFGYGDITQLTMDIETKQEPVYAKLYVVPGQVILRENRLNYNFNLIMMDVVNNDLSNQEEVISDTLETLKDVWTILYQSYTATYGGFSIDYEPFRGPNCTPFIEKYETYLAGWTLAITIEQPFDYNSCDLPDVDTAFPTNDETYSSYFQVITDFKKFADGHKQVNSFGWGDITQLTMDIETEKEPVYPKMYFIPSNSIFDENHMHMTWQVVMLDQLNNDLSNQREVMSDMLEICKDLFARAYLSDYQADWDAVCEPWLERTETVLAGWTLTMSITQPFDYNRCVLPETPFVTQNKKWYELAELWNTISTVWRKV